MIEVLLLRHVSVNGPAALYGQTDVAPKIEKNNCLLASLIQSHNLSSYDLIISSPLQRCHLLAEQFSNECQIPFICLNDFKEMNFGDLDGIPFDDMILSNKQDWQLLEKFWQAPDKTILPNSETLAQFHFRVITAWLRLIKGQMSDLSNEKESCKILLLAHGGVIRMILAHILQLDWKNAAWQQHLQIANGSCSKITITRPFNDKEKVHNVVNYIGLPMQ